MNQGNSAWKYRCAYSFLYYKKGTRMTFHWNLANVTSATFSIFVTTQFLLS